MISKKYLPQTQSFILAGIMTLLMSFAISFLNLGFVTGFIKIWAHAWLMAFVIAFPTLLLILPFVRKLSAQIASR